QRGRRDPPECSRQGYREPPALRVVASRAAFSRWRQPRILDGECGVRGRRGHSRSKPCRHLINAPAIETVRILLQRNPHVGSRLKLLTVEAGRHDANDDVRHAPECDRLSHHIRVTAKAANPETVAEDGYRWSVGTIFFGG